MLATQLQSPAPSEGELNLPRLPVIFGHQIVGVVDKVGEAVTRFFLGDRVGVDWLAG